MDEKLYPEKYIIHKLIESPLANVAMKQEIIELFKTFYYSNKRHSYANIFEAVNDLQSDEQDMLTENIKEIIRY